MVNLTDTQVTWAIVAGAIVLLMAVIYGLGWGLLGCPRWFLRCTCRDEPEPEPQAAEPGRIRAALMRDSDIPAESIACQYGGHGSCRSYPGCDCDCHIFADMTDAQVWIWLGCDVDGRPLEDAYRPLEDAGWAPRARVLVGAA